MNRTELYVDFGGGFTPIDTPDGGVQINVQAKNYEEIKDEVADYSQNISLPLTDRNISTLEYANVFDAETDISDIWHDCRLYFNSMEILGNGSKMRVISATKSNINIQLIGNKKTFFGALKGNGDEDKKLNDLNFSESVFRITRGYGGTHDINTSADWVKVFYAVCEFGNSPHGGVTLGANNEDSCFDTKQAYPCVKYDSVLRQIISEAGYTLNGSLGREYGFMCIPLCGIKKQRQTGGTGRVRVDFRQRISGQNFFLWGATFIEGYYWEYDPELPQEWISPYYRRNIVPYTYEDEVPLCTLKKIKYTIDEALRRDEAHYFKIVVEVQKPDGTWWTAVNDNQYGYMWEEYELVYPILLQGTIRISLQCVFRGNKAQDWEDYPEVDRYGVQHWFGVDNYRYDVGSYVNIPVTDCRVDFEYEIVDADKEGASVGEYIPVKGNLPDMTCDEFFRAHINMFGLTIKVDEDAKIVYFRTLQQIADNKDVAVDWSEKYNNGTGTFFRYLDGYAHRNEITYEESDAASEEVEELNIVKVNEFYARLYYNSGVPVFYSNGTNWVRCTDSVPEKQSGYAIPKSATDGGSVKLKDNAFLVADCKTNGDEKKIIELPWQSVGNRMVNMDGWRTTAPHIPVVDDGEDGGLANADADFKHVLVYSDVSYTIPVKDDEGNIIWAVKKLPFLGTSHASEQGDYGIRAEELRRNYYSVLEDNMLHDAKRIEDAEFWLTDVDIANFDPFKPVYVAKFGAYFVVNKIKNYESGKLTKVDLIKI